MFSILSYSFANMYYAAALPLVKQISKPFALLWLLSPFSCTPYSQCSDNAVIILSSIVDHRPDSVFVFDQFHSLFLTTFMLLNNSQALTKMVFRNVAIYLFRYISLIMSARSYSLQLSEPEFRDRPHPLINHYPHTYE